jgi:hypothetical protein
MFFEFFLLNYDDILQNWRQEHLRMKSIQQIRAKKSLKNLDGIIYSGSALFTKLEIFLVTVVY